MHLVTDRSLDIACSDQGLMNPIYCLESWMVNLGRMKSMSVNTTTKEQWFF